MSRVFADACYWIALINRDDELRAAALAAQKRTTSVEVFTTDEVLGEVLNYFSKWGTGWREQAARIVEGIVRTRGLSSMNSRAQVSMAAWIFTSVARTRATVWSIASRSWQ